ncbi:hypothetical protein Godav_017023 [Gossypium davidsonii]|uniref:FHA domain-containing protein n=1 Tax=Gossypium davidsonii TaxID=34287 RepID=A0A7J8QS01_GOSDV|nr:hypothetical protein [Gossypium davidsonii]
MKKSASVEVKSFDVPLFSSKTGSPIESLRLEPDRPYTIGRAKGSCNFTFGSRFVSKQHCQILYDSVDRKIFILDGKFFSNDFSFIVNEFRRRFLLYDDELEEKDKEGEEVLGFSRVRVSLNGVYVNKVKVKRGMVRELFAGDEVLLVCGNGSECSLRVRVGFVIQGIVFKEEIVSKLDEVTGGTPRSLGAMVSSRHSQGTMSSGKRNKRVFALPAKEMNRGWNFSGSKSSDAIGRAKFILSQCRSILHSDDPISCIRKCDILASGQNIFLGLTLSDRMKCAIGSEEEVSSLFPLFRQEPQSSNKNDKPLQSNSFRKVATSELDQDLFGDPLPSDLPCSKGPVECSGEDVAANNRCGMSLINVPEKENDPDVDRVGTSKISLNYCSAPGKMFYLNRLAYSDSGSSNHHSVVSLRELLYPVESISKIFIATFTSDISWFLLHCEIPCHLPVTVACHNAERCWSSSPDARTSIPFPEFPNLVAVFPPFPEVIAFGNDLKKRGIACHHPKLLVVQREDGIRVVITSANLVAKQWENVTNTVWWQDFPRRREPDYLSLFSISYGEMNNSRSDFAAQLAGFMASLIVDVPGQSHWIVELTNYDFTNAMGYLVASVPGMHSDRALKANQITPSSLDVKFLGLVEASVVGLSHLFRTTADRNGAQLKKLALFLGKTCENANGMLNVVLRRNTNIPADENAVSVLVPNPDKISSGDCIQLGFLPRNVAKWVSPLWDIGFFEFHGYVCREEALTATFGGNNKKGPSFLDMLKMIQDQNFAALCSLIASVQRCTGLWRLQEVLGQYNWPESQESDFIYGASSIGSSVSAPFLAAFAASVGKKSSQIFDSEESDPEVKNACSGISPSRRILCFSEASSSSSGWVYCGSHNFSAAAWGRPISSSVGIKASGLAQTNSTSRLHVCNYELGIIFVFPPTETKCIANQNRTKLDDVALPFIVPAPKYGPKDRPATAQAMREALAELLEREAKSLAEVEITENMTEEVSDEDDEEVHSSLTISGVINYNSHLGAQIIIKNAKFGEHNSAHSLFDSIRGDKPYSFLWNTMIRAYANGGCHVEALELYPLMRPNNLIRWRS